MTKHHDTSQTMTKHHDTSQTMMKHHNTSQTMTKHHLYHHNTSQHIMEHHVNHHETSQLNYYKECEYMWGNNDLGMGVCICVWEYESVWAHG